MASEVQVKQYVALWLQLGKKVLAQGGQQVLYPQPVLEGDQYSAEFNQCWQVISASDAGDCYLEGTDLTIRNLLTEQWQVIDCSRCAMPLPIPDAGIASPECPCHDLPSWPNEELPQPRRPIDNKHYLRGICSRLTTDDSQSPVVCS